MEQARQALSSETLSIHYSCLASIPESTMYSTFDYS